MTEYDGPKPITTVYNGLRFRSRLEARWAVLLDTIGVVYEYEVEGFELPSGWYLPDFYLPELDSWLEVKGWHLERNDKDWRKVRDLALETGQKTYIFSGQVDHPSTNFGLQFYGFEDDETGFEPERVFWWQCPVCRSWQPGPRPFDLPCHCLEYSPGEQQPLADAFTVARQARFEYGETPRGRKH